MTVLHDSNMAAGDGVLDGWKQNGYGISPSYVDEDNARDMAEFYSTEMLMDETYVWIALLQ